MSENQRTIIPLAEAVAGAIGAVVANTAVFPLDVIKTRLQVQQKAALPMPETQGEGKIGKAPEEFQQHYYTSAWDALSKILEKEGIAGLFAGYPTATLGTMAASFSYFYIYAWVRGAYLTHRARVQPDRTGMGTGAELSLGAIAGALSQFVTLPIAIVTTRQQTSTKPLTVSQIIHQILQEEGPQGLWKGLKASLILCSNPAITYGVFERLKAWWLQRMRKQKGPAILSSWQIFIIGAISKALATVMTYPYIMAKVRLQWKPPTLSKQEGGGLRVQTGQASAAASIRPYKNSLDVFRRVIASEGYTGLYKGLSAQISKATIAQAILFVSRERLTEMTYALIGNLNHVQVK